MNICFVAWLASHNDPKDARGVAVETRHLAFIANKEWEAHLQGMGFVPKIHFEELAPIDADGICRDLACQEHVALDPHGAGEDL